MEGLHRNERSKRTKGVSKSFYDSNGDNSFILFSGGAGMAVGAATAEAFGAGFAPEEVAGCAFFWSSTKKNCVYSWSKIVTMYDVNNFFWRVITRIIFNYFDCVIYY